ncbi:MAG: hypothetical protein WB116_05815 [Candidatus Dormiibacterota bacterium]
MGIVELVVLVVVVAGIVIAFFGWDRYRGGRQGGGVNGAQPTGEVFVDPATGQRMRVWYDSRTGQREYRPE